MNITELLAYLDIESPKEFSYFEHLADLLEVEEAVDYEAFYTLLKEVPTSVLEELLANYFTDIMENLPDTTVEIYTLLITIRQCLLGMVKQMETLEERRAFVDELYHFKNWYSLDGEVSVKRLSDGKLTLVSVCEALALYRAEKLNNETYDYNFDDCLDYKLDEYSMSLSDAMAPLYEEETSKESEYPDCDCGHDHHSAQGFDPYTDGLIDLENPLIDDELLEEDEK